MKQIHFPPSPNTAAGPACLLPLARVAPKAPRNCLIISFQFLRTGCSSAGPFGEAAKYLSCE